MREREYEGGAEEPVNLCGRRRIHRPSGAGQNRTGSRSVPELRFVALGLQHIRLCLKTIFMEIREKRRTNMV